MTLNGTPARCGALAAALHWISAPAIMAMLPLGFTAAHASSPARAAALLRPHLPLGLAVLGSTIARIGRWLVDVRPEMPPGQPRWQDRLARANHVSFYALIVLLCGSGIGLVALSQAASVIFSDEVSRVPDFSALPPMDVHAASACGLVALLALHLGAVLYHQLYRCDRILTRMRVGRPMGGG